MASVLDKYGIKEVADITFYELDKNGKPAYPILYIDTAKTSTIEQTADETTTNGGKGNPALISWDYNKDITVTLEDALFTAKSLAVMFGNGKVSDVKGDNIMRTEVITLKNIPTGGINVTAFVAEAADYGYSTEFQASNGKRYAKQNPKFYTEMGKSLSHVGGEGEPKNGDKIFCSYDLKMSTGSVIEISANTFPGTYYVTGDTFARAEANGDDEFFQFILPKAKVKSENTITLEADGDPTVFTMNLHVLRPADGVMMKLIKYDIAAIGDATTDTDLYHNHTLNAEQNDDGTTVDVDDSIADDPARQEGLNDAHTAWVNNYIPASNDAE